MDECYAGKRIAAAPAVARRPSKIFSIRELLTGGARRVLRRSMRAEESVNSRGD
jgi:hypothetical protein